MAQGNKSNHPWKYGTPEEKAAGAKRANRRRRLKVIGLNVEIFDAAVVAQGNLCALCFEPLKSYEGRDRDSAVPDHDHVTGKFRGVIHRNCNVGIGMLGDSIKRLRLAVAYLERHKCD